MLSIILCKWLYHYRYYWFENVYRFNTVFFCIQFISAIISAMTTLLCMLYKINWFMFTVYSNTSEVEYVFNSHNFHIQEIHTSCRRMLVLYWYIMAFSCQMNYMESVYCLDETQSITFIDSVSIFCFKVLSGKLSEI